jgi:uncharacterized protein (DUF4415 family)
VINADVLAWLKHDGDKDYKKRLNAILRDAMLRTNPKQTA